MGAICGWSGRPDATVVGRMLEALAHRGTTVTDSYLDQHTALAVRSDSDPFTRGATGVASSEDGAVHVALDGWLSNHREISNELLDRGVTLRTSSHAELIANALVVWGDDCFERLDGAFAVAAARGDEIVLARDAIGERVLYYVMMDGSFLFASETKAFAAHPGFRAEPDRSSLVRLLVFSFVPGDATMFRGVSEVLPGEVLVRKAGEAPRRRLYFELRERRREGTEQELVAETRVALEAAVAKRLPEGERVAAFLSGGLDSSAVVAVLHRLGADVTAYSLSFGNEHPNELGFAQRVAKHVGIPHRLVEVRPESFVEALPRVIFHLDDPHSDCITVPNFLLAGVVARESQIVFNGEGGDPIFGGPKNKFMILHEWYRSMTETSRERAYLSSYHRFYDVLDELCTKELLEDAGGIEALDDIVRPYLEDPRFDAYLNRLFHINTKLKGGQSILVKVDKMLAANGVSPRSPLFDRRLAELAFAIPPEHKRRGDVEKYVLKRAVEDLLPHEVVYRKKVGMGVPLGAWFREGALADYARDVLSPARLAARGYFRPEFVEHLLAGHAPEAGFGRNRSGELLWMLLAVELWHRVFVEGEGRRDA